jgi:anti-sigma B factor antagonist
MTSVCSERKQAGAVTTEGGSPGGGQAAVPPVGGAGQVPDFTLALVWRGGTAVLILTGELDLYRAPEIEDALAEAAGREPDARSEGARRLTVDLRSVTLIDSTMLGLLLAASRRHKARGAELNVLVGPQTPMTAFEVTGVDRLLAISRDDDGTNARRA